MKKKTAMKASELIKLSSREEKALAKKVIIRANEMQRALVARVKIIQGQQCF